MSVAVVDITGKDTGRKVKLNEEIFGIEPNDHAIYLDVKQHLANQRQGTHKSKQRGEISGSTRKLHRQKGTGGSRKGSIKNPLFRGGGRIFGPQPRNYDFKLNKKVKRLARISALTYKAKENSIHVIEDFKFEQPKTKEFLSVMKNLNLGDKKVLLLTSETNTNLVLSSRNVQKKKVSRAADLNTYDVLYAQNIVLVESAVDVIEKTLLK
ncbi:MAG TPA: 50S ribosomal protein L4 [Bacteroidia bacterium]|nr:50S ribosomal protein L4 [Bacteroidia bacterium]